MKTRQHKELTLRINFEGRKVKIYLNERLLFSDPKKLVADVNDVHNFTRYVLLRMKAEVKRWITG